MSWGIISIGLVIYAVIPISSNLIKEYTAKNGFFVHLVSALISLTGSITFLLFWLFEGLREDLAIILTVFLFSTFLLELYLSLERKYQEKKDLLRWEIISRS